MCALSGTFRVGDRRVWCSFVGERRDRPPLIVVPGGPGAAHLYLRALEAFAPLRTVVFFDSLGSGQSDRPVRDWSPQDLVLEIEELVRVVGAPRYHLLGHSAAGFGVFPFALSHPPELATLVLASCYPSIPAYHAEMHARLERLSPADQAHFVAAEHDVRLRDPRYVEIAVDHVRQHFHAGPPPDLMRGMEGTTNVRAHRQIKGGSVLYTSPLATWDVTGRLGEIAVPTLLTCGRHDFVTPAMCTAMQRAIPDAEVAVFEHSAHMPHLEETDAYVARVEAFLAAHD